MQPKTWLKSCNSFVATIVRLRASGRYSLSISKNKPEQVTSKWKKIVSPEQQFLFVKECFENGNALKWWKIFGDGRDFSINKFINSYGV